MSHSTPVDLRAEAAHRKTLVMEHSVARLRAMVVACNVLAWALFIGPSAPRAPIAIAIIVTAVPYAIWSVVSKPYEKYPLLRFGVATLAMDALLITVWTYGTGGTASEFWIIYFVSIVSVAMRYDLVQTVATAVGESALLVAMYLFDGAETSIAMLVRPSYIVIVGFAAGLLARQERIHRDERVVFEQLAAEHAEMLSRERVTVERLREIDRLKTEFVAHASHELRTPLTTLSGLASTLAHRGDEMSQEQTHQALLAMERQGERARMLIENLLDLTQLEHGSMTINKVPIVVEAAFREALQMVPPPDGHRVEIDVDTNAVAMADRYRFGQVVTNLLVNAYHYGGTNVRCSAQQRNGSVIVSVSDDGEGVPEELRETLFQPFRRGENIRGHIGSGLGLAICMRMVEAFGGSLSYEQEMPHGARFMIELPRAS